LVCGGPGGIRSGWGPSFSHQIDRRLNPPGALLAKGALAKGAPFSGRIRSGQPNAPKAASNTACASA
jgi:hypothetical protein